MNFEFAPMSLAIIHSASERGRISKVSYEFGLLHEFG
jgi:hypothetical protein